VTRALVVGAGSIGTRHARVLSGLGHQVAVVSARESDEFERFAGIPEALSAFDPAYVVVATETARHAASVDELAGGGFHGMLLVEKPLSVPVAALAAFDRVGVGFNLRFHPVIARVAELLAATQVFTVEVYAGQHLSGWRPDRPLSDQYSASRARGGGVLRDLSHELDYLGRMLGGCRGAFARGGRLAEVTVDSDDAWGIVAEYERAPIVTVQLNYLDTTARRRIVATTASGTVEADVIAGIVRHGDRTEELAGERDDTYASMHRAMLEGSGTVATAAEATATEDVIAMIEASASEARWVAAS
jgi:predicted dehydrogenase